MPNYANSKVYKLTGTNSEGNSITYFGSTTKKYLCQRLAEHRCDAKRKINSSKKVIDCEDCQITLLELFPCSSKDELIARERFYIESNDCVNDRIPGRTKKQWVLENKEHVNEYRRNWGNKNRECVNEYQRNWREKIKHLNNLFKNKNQN